MLGNIHNVIWHHLVMLCYLVVQHRITVSIFGVHQKTNSDAEGGQKCDADSKVKN
jgi:hypothetical protein